MAEYLTMKMHHLFTPTLANTRSNQLALVLLIGLALLLINPAQAELLIDPTQAPAALYADDSSAVEIAGPVLQSVMIGPHYRAAIISGEKVMLGKKYAQSTLIKLNEREAVLRHADRSTQILVLNPVMVKSLINTTATSKTTPAAAKKSMQSKPNAQYTN